MGSKAPMNDLGLALLKLGEGEVSFNDIVKVIFDIIQIILRLSL
jgi:hypothetical protein